MRRARPHGAPSWLPTPLPHSCARRVMGISGPCTSTSNNAVIELVAPTGLLAGAWHHRASRHTTPRRSSFCGWLTRNVIIHLTAAALAAGPYQQGQEGGRTAQLKMVMEFDQIPATV